MYSDYLEIANLQSSAVTYPLRVKEYIRDKVDRAIPVGGRLIKDIPLIGYSLVTYFGIVMLPVWLFRVSYDSYQKVTLSPENAPFMQYGFDQLLVLGKIITLFSLLLFVMYRTVYYMIVRFSSGLVNPPVKSTDQRAAIAGSG